MDQAPSLRISARLVYAASLFRATGDFSECLTGVMVQPLGAKGVAIMANNGHAAIVLRDESGTAPYPMTLRVTKPLLAVCKPQGSPSRFVVARDYRLVVETINEELYIQPGVATIQGEYPNTLKHFEREWSPCVVYEHMHSKRLLLDALRYLGIHTFAAFTSGEVSPILYRGHRRDADYFAAVIMPVRQGTGNAREISPAIDWM